MPIKILDIDLDFFLNNRATSISNTSEKRLSSNFYIPWKADDVIAFLEVNCGIKNKIYGKLFKHHVEVFDFLRSLQEDNNYSVKFNIDHVDAHADLGYGDLSYKYISEEVIAKPIKERADALQKNGWYGISSGNYLAFAVACRWINKLRYINHSKWLDDLPWFNFKNFDVSENLQLKQYSLPQMKKILNNSIGMIEMAKRIKPMSLEPCISFECIDRTKFKSNGKFDYLLLTQSPGYTPKKSDALIPIIQSYISEFSITCS